MTFQEFFAALAVANPEAYGDINTTKTSTFTKEDLDEIDRIFAKYG